MNTVHFDFFKKAMVYTMILTALSCVDKPNQNNDDTDDTDDQTEQEVSAPAQIVSVAQAKTMYDTYTMRRIGLIQENEQPNPDGTPFNPTRYGWYDYDMLKQYMAYIEQEADKADVDISGLQLYFANYPDKSTFEDGRPVKYPRQNTFLIMPTMKVDGEDVAFLTSGEGDDWRAIPMRAKIEEMFRANGVKDNKGGSGFGPKMMMINMSSAMGLEEEEHSLVLNELSLIPPPNQETDLDK